MCQDYESKLSEMAITYKGYVIKVNQSKYKIDLSKWKVHVMLLLTVSILLNIGLLTVHILSVDALIDYSNDVFLQSDLDSSYAFIATSIFVLVITYLGAGIYFFCTKYRNKSGEKKNDKYISITAMSITVNVIYLGYYFMPYMLLAFIYHPLQAFVTYLTLLFYVLPTMYFTLVFVKYACKRCCKSQENPQENHHHDKLSEEQKALHVLGCYSPFLFGIFVYFTIAILYILTSGNFNDFEIIGNVIPTLLIAMFTYLVVNVKKQAEQKFNLTSKAQDHKETNTENNDINKELVINPTIPCNNDTNDDITTLTERDIMAGVHVSPNYQSATNQDETKSSQSYNSFDKFARLEAETDFNNGSPPNGSKSTRGDV